jgi:predicted nucleic acid-binding Zn ribbon protein
VYFIFRFPKSDQNMREKWISVIRENRNEPMWHPASHSVVCSTHFQSNDLYCTPKGFHRVKRKTYPKVLIFFFIKISLNGWVFSK